MARRSNARAGKSVVGATARRPRNPLALVVRQRAAGPHGPTRKAQRAASKQAEEASGRRGPLAPPAWARFVIACLRQRDLDVFDGQWCRRFHRRLWWIKRHRRVVGYRLERASHPRDTAAAVHAIDAKGLLHIYTPHGFVDMLRRRHPRWS